MKDKIHHFAILSGDNRHWTPEQMLREALTDVDVQQADRAMLIYSRDGGVSFYAANIDAGKMIYAMEVVKARLIQEDV